MGYGGALIWTAVFKKIKNDNPRKLLIVIYKPYKNKEGKKTISSKDIYDNNQDVFLFIEDFKWARIKKFIPKFLCEVVDLNDSRRHYWNGDNDEKIIFKKDLHAIELGCLSQKIDLSVYRPVINYRENEKGEIKALLSKKLLLDKPYICVCPVANEEFGINKSWFVDSWQKVVYKLKERFESKIEIVQLGLKKDILLDGVIDLREVTSFRKTGLIIRESILLVSTEGGLVHLANAVGTKSVIVASALAPGELFSYPNDYVIRTKIECENCGYKIKCPFDKECMRQITPEHVLAKFVDFIEAQNVFSK